MCKRSKAYTISTSDLEPTLNITGGELILSVSFVLAGKQNKIQKSHLYSYFQVFLTKYM